jgi:transposase
MGGRVVTNENFCRVWCGAHQDGHGIPEVAHRLGINYAQTYSQFDRLKKAGVNLPYLFGQRPRLRAKIKALNDLIQKEMGGV